jgi:adenylosuccinate synthase
MREQFIHILSEPLDFEIVDLFDLVRRRIKIANMVFEGSQGVLLDQEHGVFPNVTHAHTTSKNAIELIEGLFSAGTITVNHVTRSYGTRHGNGWTPNPSVAFSNFPLLKPAGEEINVRNEYQGEFRAFDLDRDVLKHAAQMDKICFYRSKGEKFLNPKFNLIVTCVDQNPFTLDGTERTIWSQILFNDSPESGHLQTTTPQ